MSFSVTAEKANLEYNGNNLNSLFAQRRNIFRPRFWRIVNDILKFNKACKAMVAEERDTASLSLQDIIDELKLSDDFANYYILPMCAAIWSSSLEQTRGFPLTFFLQFFNNHGLLNITDRPQWYTIKGGSSAYIPPLIAPFKSKIKLSTGVTLVTQQSDRWEVTDTNGEKSLYDDVIFACHSDQALAMLAMPTQSHIDILGAIPYANNDVVMHKDSGQLPKRPLAWASWNFAPNAKVRAEVTASQRGKNSPRLAEHLKDSDKPYHARSMSWAQRLKRVFNIDITVCEACEKTNVKIITCITDPAVIHKILAHLDKQTLLEAKNDSLMPPLRAPPATASFSDYIIQRDFDFGA